MFFDLFLSQNEYINVEYSVALDKYIIKSNSYLMCDSIFLEIEGYWFEIPCSDLLKVSTYNEVLIKPSTDGTFTLGSLFLRNYLSIFDYD